MAINLFYRKNQNVINNSYTQWVSDALSFNTLNKWNIKKTLKYYDKEYKDWYLWYRFNILHEWFNANRNEDDLDFLDKLNSVIKALNLEGYLNANEKNYIYEIHSQNFTKVRNIKSLLIDFEANENELAYFHYRHIHMVAPFLNWNDADFYLTNERIVIIYRNDILSFFIDKIQSIDYFDKHFNVTYQSKVYRFYTARSKIIKISIERMLKIIKKEKFLNGGY